MHYAHLVGGSPLHYISGLRKHFLIKMSESQVREGGTGDKAVFKMQAVQSSLWTVVGCLHVAMSKNRSNTQTRATNSNVISQILSWDDISELERTNIKLT